MKKSKYIIGIDGGSQSSKVVIFDLQGNVISTGKQELKPLHMPRSGIVEYSEDDLWESIKIASQKVMANFSGNVKDIIGVGLGSIRFCRAMLKKDGTLAQPVLSWMDERVSRSYEAENPSVAFITTATGYLTHRFTREFTDTAANYQGVWPIDTDTWSWLEEEQELQPYHVTKDMLFDLKMPGDILGYVSEVASQATSIPSGLPVIATANDKAVEALGAGLKGPSTVLISLGTYIAAMIEGVDNPKDTINFWTNFASEPGKYLYESHGIRRGMWMVSWYKQILGEDFIRDAAAKGKSVEEILNTEAQTISAGSDGLMTVLDWLAPVDQPYKKGVFLGFDGRHTRAHIYRSILEAIALTMKNHTAAMCQELEIDLQQVIISGGGSNSELFMQIFADVFGIPTQRNVVNGSASLGAAICVAVGLGIYDSYEEAIENMVQVKDIFEPEINNAQLYQRMNQEVYQQMSTITDQILKKSYEIFQ